MPSFLRTANLSIAAAMGLAIMAPASAMAQGACDAYAKISLKQQTQNIAKKCNIIGPQWDTNYLVHKSWCARVPPKIWKEMARSRQLQLKNCKK